MRQKNFIERKGKKVNYEKSEIEKYKLLFFLLAKTYANMPMCCLVRNGHYKQHNHNNNTKEKITKFYYGILYDF